MSHGWHQPLAALDAQIAQLTGKDSRKERSAKSKDVLELKASPQYIVASKVAKGLEPKNGFFVKSAAAPAKTEACPDAKAAPAEPPALFRKEKKEKEYKKSENTESAGLRSDGRSGGLQIKDLQSVECVKRMSEIEDKENPGSMYQADKKRDAKKKSSAPLCSEKELDALRGDIDIYKHGLKMDFR